ncbi:hypothetical protein [Paraburkholderia sp. C35]|uniref:hypothetical protein n=1 Tax=Paraburkholderia sp. C35 TaxID=2126993 RepID=UPI000D694CC2|nr:hypothetical protein [Paraburkholderia sp. C35]
MKSLWRILVVLTLVLLGMQGASACEHHHGDAARTMRMQQVRQASVVHCATSMNMDDASSSCHRTHSLCCMSACGAHCSALLSAIGVTARVASSDVPATGSDPARTSVTRAPPVRPPIV